MGKLVNALLANWPTDRLNTLLYIYGAEHWQSMVTLYMRYISENKNVMRISGAEFVELSLKAAMTDSTNRFRDVFLMPEILFLENLEQISNQRDAQKDLYVILDKRTEHHLPTIISADEPPRDYIGQIENRLISIFEGYLLADTAE